MVFQPEIGSRAVAFIMVCWRVVMRTLVLLFPEPGSRNLNLSTDQVWLHTRDSFAPLRSERHVNKVSSGSTERRPELMPQRIKQ